MDEKPLTLEGVKEALRESSPSQKPSETIKREIDSLDDFEHLGHDSSPLKETISQDAGDLLGGIQTTTRDPFEGINKRVVESAANKFTDELSSSAAFDPFNSVSSGSNLSQETNKMDTNLLQMGDNFPDRKEADDKLDKFLQEMSSPFTAPISPQEKAVEEKYNVENFIASTKNFVDNERDIIQPPPSKFISTTTTSANVPLLQSNDDLLDRYTDSEPEDDFKPSKYEDFPKKQELPESFSSSDNFKSDVFKDVVDEPLIDLPKKEYHDSVVKPSTPAPEPPKPSVVEKVEIVKEQTPEPVKLPEKTPEPAKKVVEDTKKAVETKPKIVHTGAEAIFCKMGLGKC